MPDLKPPSYTEHLTIFADLLGFEEAIGTADDSLRLSILKLLTDLAALRADFFISSTQVIAAPVVKAGRARAYVRRHLPSGFEKATVLEVGGDAGRAEAVVADAGLMPTASRAGSVLSLGSPAAPITQQLGDRRAGACPIRGFHGLGMPCSVAAGAFVRRIRQRSSSGKSAFGQLRSAPRHPTTDSRPSAISISTGRRVSSLRLIVITVIPRHPDKPQANRGA